MKKELVKTSNYERYRTAISAVERRGAPEASWVLVAGHPGVSKSIIVNRWAVDTKAVYLRAKTDWTPNRFLEELAAELGVDMAGRRQEVYGRIVAAIGKQQLPLIVDEVQHTLREGARTLEAVRDISDLTETIVVLVAGSDDVLRKIGRFPQLSSRIARIVEFQLASVEDVERTCKELAEVDFARDLVEEIHRQTGGVMRPVINVIAAIDADAKRSGKKKVTLADYAGKTLTTDWSARMRQPRQTRHAPHGGNGSAGVRS